MFENPKSWYAWLNVMPPPPDDFHVVGTVLVANPGIEGVLRPRVPQGINPAMLQLELHLVQRPGVWIQVMTWIQVRYDLVIPPTLPAYQEVEIFQNGISIATVKVDIIQ